LNKKNTGKHIGTTYCSSNYSNTTKSRSKPMSISEFIEKSESELKAVKEIKDEERNDNEDNENNIAKNISPNKSIRVNTKSVNERINTISITDNIDNDDNN